VPAGPEEPSLSTTRSTMSDLRRLAAHPATTALLALLFVLLLGFIFSGDGAFYKWTTHRDALRQASVFGILACGMTLVIITAGIDLSVGSVLALVAVTFSLFAIHWRWSPWLAIPACLAVGTACGAVSGGIIAKLRIQPFIMTLAMMVFARGLAKTVSGGMKVSTAVANDDGTYTYVDVPQIFRMIDAPLSDTVESLQARIADCLMSMGSHLGLEWVVESYVQAQYWVYQTFGIRAVCDNVSTVTIVFLVCVIVSWILLSRLRWGRYLYAIGGNEEAARLSGVPVTAMKILAYGAAGLFAAVAGLCQAAQEQQGDPEAGTAYELTAIAIVVIGGTNLMGGRGGIGLTLLGTLTIGYLEKILSINAVPEAGRLMLTGIIIIAAVLLQRRRA